MRVLVVAHGHPEARPGGGEIAAHTMFKGLNQLDDVQAYFLARTDDPSHNHTGTRISAVMNRPNELLFYFPKMDYFLFSGLQDDTAREEFAALVDHLQPDVVHFHHYVHIGLETIAIVRRVRPHCRIVVTLHEFLAICNNHGQMVKTGTLALCSEATPAACARCYPKKSSSDFFLRQSFIQSHFEKVDLFIAPSDFLRQRYIHWGIPVDKIIMLENFLPSMDPVPPRPLAVGERRSIFAYFGTINTFKGIRILIDAFESLENLDGTDDIRLLIFGTSPSAGSELQDWFGKAVKRNPRRISYQGPYRRDILPQLMASVDWVVMASLWWENSPLVIHEAFDLGRPVICPDIGGMAEKVIHGVNGLHFQVGNSFALADTIRSAVAHEETTWQRLATGATARSVSGVLTVLMDCYTGDQTA